MARHRSGQMNMPIIQTSAYQAYRRTDQWLRIEQAVTVEAL